MLALKSRVDALYEHVGRFHIEPPTLNLLGQPPFHEALFEPAHAALVDAVLGAGWWVSISTATRRIGPEDATHMRPLKPHIDAFFHAMAPTLNFWTPFQPCGDGKTPSLAVWDVPLAEMAARVAFDPVARSGAPSEWNFKHFAPRWWPLNLGEPSPWFAEEFGPGYAPRMAVGDAIILTNWTLHATGPGNPEAIRSNVELRFQGPAVVPSFPKA